MLEGLTLAYAKGFKKIELVVDSTSVVRTISGGGQGGMVGRRIVNDILKLLDLDWEVMISQNFREANKCVDALAAMACRQIPELVIYDAVG